MSEYNQISVIVLIEAIFSHYLNLVNEALIIFMLSEWFNLLRKYLVMIICRCVGCFLKHESIIMNKQIIYIQLTTDFISLTR